MSQELTIIRAAPFYKGVTREHQSPTHDTKLTYTPGTTVRADGIDLDPTKACGRGINFCRSLAEALKWGPVVVTLTVPEGTVVVDTGSKLRAERVVVGEVADLRGANLGDADLRGANLWDANLRDADLRGANLRGADLRGANLRGANLGGANLRGANLGGANLGDANLGGANLGGADLRGANLRGANLWDADLRGANLRGANLWDADLRDANLRGADLWDANLRGANLWDADIRGANLDQTRGNAYTTLPFGYKVTDAGLIVRTDG